MDSASQERAAGGFGAGIHGDGYTTMTHMTMTYIDMYIYIYIMGLYICFKSGCINNRLYFIDNDIYIYIHTYVF